MNPLESIRRRAQDAGKIKAQEPDTSHLKPRRCQKCSRKFQWQFISDTWVAIDPSSNRLHVCDPARLRHNPGKNKKARKAAIYTRLWNKPV